MGTITRITTREEAIDLTRHSGWCTGFTHTDEHWNSYATNGDIFIYYKDGKRRPSYQVFFPNKDSRKRFEMKHVGNNLISSEKVKGLPDLCAFIIERIGNDQFIAYLKAHERERGYSPISHVQAYSELALRNAINSLGVNVQPEARHVPLQTIIEESHFTLLRRFDFIRESHPPQDAPSADMREIGIPSLPFAENGSFSLKRGEYNHGGIPFLGFSYRLLNGVYLRGLFCHVNINLTSPSMIPDAYSARFFQAQSLVIESMVEIMSHDILLSRRISGDHVFNIDDIPNMLTADAVLAFHALVIDQHYSYDLRQIRGGINIRHSLT